MTLLTFWGSYTDEQLVRELSYDDHFKITALRQRVREAVESLEDMMLTLPRYITLIETEVDDPYEPTPLRIQLRRLGV